MDPINGFYQELDSEQLLERHGTESRADAGLTSLEVVLVVVTAV